MRSGRCSPSPPAVVGGDGDRVGGLVKAASLAEVQDIPLSFLQGILLDLRRAGLLHSHRGAPTAGTR